MANMAVWVNVTWFLCLSVGAMIGATARYFIGELASYGGRGHFTSEYALVVGCFVLGILVTTKKNLHPLVSMGIGTGFCGCCTTFSTWQLEASVQVLRGPLSAEPAILSSAMDQAFTWLRVLFTGLYVSIGAYFGGIACGYLFTKREDDIDMIEEDDIADITIESPLGQASQEQVNRVEDGDNGLFTNDSNDIDLTTTIHELEGLADVDNTDTQEDESRIDLDVVESVQNHGVFLLLVVGVIFIIVLVTILLIATAPSGSPNAQLAWITLFAPIGALCRHLLCSKISKRSSFKVIVWNGTYVANVIGCIILAVLVVVQSTTTTFTKENVVFSIDSVLTGLLTGFCGSITTVSTFISDAHKMAQSSSKREAVYYVILSMVTGQVIVFTILGAYVNRSGDHY
eukprot:m.74353 g.74353  ORF g.74353 m.74353 type:complete len:400 (+) comp8451_c0_seq1:29-1228(+)